MPDYDDLNDHPVAIFQAGESYVSERERAWLRWIKQAERLAGHSLDGDEADDGYSLDWAYAAWEAGETPAQYIAEIADEESHSDDCAAAEQAEYDCEEPGR